jgi:SAM-dependent methyltransferase
MTYDTILHLLDVLSKPAGDEPGFKYKTLLDIGCGNGLFVKDMIMSGIDTVGLDLAPRMKSSYIETGDARYLAETFGNQKFDVITANGVLNAGGLLEMLMITDPITARQLERKKRWGKKEAELMHGNAMAILRSCYAQLNTPGLFINSEGNHGEDYVVYTKRDAAGIGFVPFIFRKDVAVLTKQ